MSAELVASSETRFDTDFLFEDYLYNDLYDYADGVVVDDDESFDDWLYSLECSDSSPFPPKSKGVRFMNFLKSAWFSVCVNLLDALIHYLDRKGVIELESHSPEE